MTPLTEGLFSTAEQLGSSSMSIFSTGYNDMNDTFGITRENICFLAGVRCGLWCLTPHSTIFQLYRGGQIYLWRKAKYQEKTTDLSQGGKTDIINQTGNGCLLSRSTCYHPVVLQTFICMNHISSDFLYLCCYIGLLYFVFIPLINYFCTLRSFVFICATFHI